MKQFLAGVIVGALALWIVPAGAHHRKSYNGLDARLDQVEQMLEQPTICGSNDAVTWPFAGSGFRCGDVDASQLDVPTGCSGDTAVWNTSSGLDC